LSSGIALKVAKPGDKIFVAQGNYVGLRDKGYLEAPQPVELMGGYSSDFSSRDIVKFATTVAPNNESAASGRKPLLSILRYFLSPKRLTYLIEYVLHQYVLKANFWIREK